MSAPTIAAPSRPVPRPQPRVERDRVVDLVRAFCVLGVVTLHALMVGVTVTADGPVFANAAETGSWIVPVSWALQVMPLFFVIGGFSGLQSFRRRGDGAAFVAGRVHRLLAPALVVVGAAGALLGILLVLGVPAGIVAVAGYRYGQPLWFLGAFLLCQSLLPALAAAHARAPWRTIALLAAAAGLVDLMRAATGLEAIGYLNLAFVWLTLQQLGFLLADGAIDALSRRSRVAAVAGAIAVLALAFASGAWSPDLVAHLNPPTTALLLVGIAHTCLLSLARPQLARLARRRPVRAFTEAVTPRAMTVYLWHMPVLLTLAGLTAVAAMTGLVQLPAPGSAAWWLGRPAWLIAAFALTALVVVPLARREAVRPPAPAPPRRLAAAVPAGLGAVVLLLAVGTTSLTAACAVGLLALALRLARDPDAGSGSSRRVTGSARLLG